MWLPSVVRIIAPECVQQRLSKCGKVPSCGKVPQDTESMTAVNLVAI